MKKIIFGVLGLIAFLILSGFAYLEINNIGFGSALPSTHTATSYKAFYLTTTNTMYWYNGISWIPMPAGTAWILGGNATGANVNIGSTDAFRVGITTNGTARVYFDASGRLVSGTLTDGNLTFTDSLRLKAATIDLEGVVKLTGNVNMNTNAINNASRVISDSINVLSPAFLNAATWDYQNYTSNTPTLNRRGAIYWDGTADGTATTDPALPDGTLFFVKNNDPSFLLTVAAGSGNTLNGDGRIYPSDGVWFQKHGTVIERITRFRSDYRADLSPTTDANGDFTVTHNLGTTSVAYSFASICDACRYSFRRKTTSGITSNTIVVRVYNEATGLPLASTSLSVSVMVQRI